MVLTQSVNQYELLFPEKKFWMLIEIDQFTSGMRLKTTHPQYHNRYTQGVTRNCNPKNSRSGIISLTDMRLLVKLWVSSNKMDRYKIFKNNWYYWICQGLGLITWYCLFYNHLDCYLTYWPFVPWSHDIVYFIMFLTVILHTDHMFLVIPMTNQCLFDQDKLIWYMFIDVKMQ